MKKTETEEELSKQYNKWTFEHDWMTLKYDTESRARFYSLLDFETKGKKLLDIGCGSGHDLFYYKIKLGCNVSGVESSESEIEFANKRLGEDVVVLGTADALPFDDTSFDIIVSKYAPQGFPDIHKFYKEVVRVLKPGGHFVILATHPMRHFLEKTEKPRDYFKREVVTSWIYEHTLPLQEYSHTFNDYFSDYFLNNFQISEFKEYCDTPDCVEYVDGETYPAYFILKAMKK